MALALLYTLLFALCGLGVSALLFRKQRLVLRIWLGLVLGLLLLTWLPSLFAFLLGFGVAAQALAGVAALLLAGGCLISLFFKHGFSALWKGFQKRDLGFLWITVPLFVLGSILFSTHILHPDGSGGVSVGQVTYGDLAMHLGFISSIATQGTFPPEYSIFPGHTVNYPFLCETSASSLVVLGANLRQAYLISALYAYLLVILGVWFFFREWLRTNRRATVATALFFLGGGFGFAYFFDLAKHGASLNTLLDGTYFSNFSWLLDGFYDTPTNLPTIGLRWVNPIVDMLIPQRATLFGWAFLFPCLTLLHGFTFRDKRENALPLGILAGLLPLIHTHSFLALGVISAVYCVGDLLLHFKKDRLFGWLLYGGLAVLLAAPQLFGFAFRQASESGMVQLHWNWANEADSYLWFYLKNWGWLFLFLPIAFLVLSRRDRKVFCGPLALWLLAEIMVFQPNFYDNNKLLFVVFAFVCGLSAKLICVVFRRLSRLFRTHSTVQERTYTHLCSALVLSIAVFLSFATKFQHDGSIAWYTICTLLFLLGLALYLLLCAAAEQSQRIPQLLLALAGLCILYPMIELLLGLWRGYAQTTLYLDRKLLWIALIALVLSMLLMLAVLLRQRPPKSFSAAASHVAMHLVIYVLTLTLTLSSAMTILRELKSEYRVYSENDLAVTEYIAAETEPDSLFLANSYLWNLVTPLTGRNIVTGTSTFLYFHGIDNSQREYDVRAMYEAPAENSMLFSQYGVDYILISSAERYQYDIDYDWIDTHAALVFDNSSARIYRLLP